MVQDQNSPLFNRAVLGRYPGGELITSLFTQDMAASFWNKIPQTRLDQFSPPNETDNSDLRFSPLQLALAASAISTNGEAPAPTIVNAVNMPDEGWRKFDPIDEPQQLFSQSESSSISNIKLVKGKNIWQEVGTELTSRGEEVTWYIGGTNPDWNGTPYGVVIMIEEDNAQSVIDIGQMLLSSVMQID